MGQTLIDGIAEPLARIDHTCRALRRANDQNTVVVSAPAAYLSYRLIPALHRFWRCIRRSTSMCALRPGSMGRPMTLMLIFRSGSCMIIRKPCIWDGVAGARSVIRHTSRRKGAQPALAGFPMGSFCTNRSTISGQKSSRTPSLRHQSHHNTEVWETHLTSLPLRSPEMQWRWCQLN